MASDETMTVLSSLQDDDDTDDGSDLPLDIHRHPHNLSRLSMCSSSLYTNEGDRDEDDDDQMRMYMSRLSVESFDADEEFSDDKDGEEMPELFSGDDSDKVPSCYSLPATPPRRRGRRGALGKPMGGAAGKDYASENEARSKTGKTKAKNLRRRKTSRERWAAKVGGFSGESESGGGGVLVITRPKGGRRSLCMDLEEVKACRDLGFELEHERMLEMPSSGGDSPIANWRISSPGYDPRDVKARLKVWAQAVALASASRHCI